MSIDNYHIHHILPKHMGGTDEETNLIKLTVDAHAEAHKKLWEEYGHWQDYLAWQGLSKRVGREELIKMKSYYTHLGKPKSEEHRQKLSESHKGKIFTEETKNKMSLSAKGNKNRRGKPMSDELKKQYSQNMTGIKRGPYKKNIDS